MVSPCSVPLKTLANWLIVLPQYVWAEGVGGGVWYYMNMNKAETVPAENNAGLNVEIN